MTVTCGNRAHTTRVYLEVANAAGAWAEDRYVRGDYQHNNAAEVRACFAADKPLMTLTELDDEEADRQNMEAEYQAERRAERYYEEGPHGPEEDPQERALWALEDAMRPTNSHTL